MRELIEKRPRFQFSLTTYLVVSIWGTAVVYYMIMFPLALGPMISLAALFLAIQRWKKGKWLDVFVLTLVVIYCWTALLFHFLT